MSANASLLSGGTALVTGATGGIGQAIARALAAEGANVILTGRRTDVLEPLAAELGGRALSVDLAVRGEAERLASEVGAVDVLVNNAALPASGPIDDFSQDQIDRALEVNLRAPIALTHALAPGMTQRGRGHIIFVSSLSGRAASVGTALYSATKFGLRGFGLALREDLRPSGVGVSVVLPGFIAEAGMFAESNVELPRGVGTRKPEDVARGVITAIRKNRAEVEVAPLGLRLATTFSSLAPDTAAAVARRIGSDKVSQGMGEGQKNKR
jgi:uncharacterized protein